MAEGSAFWDGTVTGDAAGSVWAGAYSYAEHADLFSKLLASNQAAGYVVPGKDDELEVVAIPGNGLGVLVKSGTAFIRGLLYENSSTTILTLDAPSTTNPRLDRIVLRITFASQIVRLGVVKGTAAGSPALPALTQNATTYEIEIATIYVGSAVTGISNEDIWDKRKFIANSYAKRISSKVNNILNSEWMASGGNANTTSQYWYGVWSSSATSTHPLVSRGHTLTFNGTTAFYQDILVKPNTKYVLKCLLGGAATTDGINVSIVSDSVTPSSISKRIKYISITNDQFEFLIYFTTESDATSIRLSFYGKGKVVGGVLLCEGVLPGPFREISEFLPFQAPIYDPTYGVVAPANTTMDFTVDYYQGKGVPIGTRAAMFNVISMLATAAGGGYYGIKSRDTGSKLAFETRMHDDRNSHYWSTSGWVAIYDRKAYTKTASLDGFIIILLQGLIT